MKLIIAGFDAFDSKWFESSSLPNIKKLRENSQWGTLYSEEMRTGPCWSTILTGWNIKTHGITHLLGMPLDGSSWFGARPHDYIFDVIGDESTDDYSTVGVVNFPSLYKSRKVKGWMIGGWPEKPDIYPHYVVLPENIYTDLPDYEKRAIAHLKPKGANQDWSIHEYPWCDYVDFVKKNIKRRFDFIDYLSTVDVFMIQESVLDRAGHMLSTPNKGRKGAYDERYQEALAIVDDMIGYLIEKYNPEYFSIVSDHGFDGTGLVGHSKDGVWSLCGKDILKCRNNTEQVNYTPTILDALGIDVERDGKSVLIKQSNVERQLKGLGYI